MSLVRYRENEIPPLPPEYEAEQLMPENDGEIDLSDMPELDEDFFKRAIPGRFYRPIKQHTTLRIDSDVLAWFKQSGKGYQKHMNEVLREAMLRERGLTKS